MVVVLAMVLFTVQACKAFNPIVRPRRKFRMRHCLRTPMKSSEAQRIDTESGFRSEIVLNCGGMDINHPQISTKDGTCLKPLAKPVNI